jgi:H+-transporting ATPase
VLVRIVFVFIVIEMSFFQDTFGAQLETPRVVEHNNRQLYMSVYLPVFIISQALVVVTRSHGTSFMERPSVVVGVFCVAQAVSSITVACANWDLASIHSTSGR